jgi:N-acetylglutamate synthase-like GNAT family acetyltransferase
MLTRYTQPDRSDRCRPSCPLGVDGTLWVVDLLPAGPDDRPALEAALRGWNALRVARRGELVESLDHPAVLAWSDGGLAGVATYVLGPDSCELLTLHATTRRSGAGTALVAAVERVARDAGCRRLWVVTTNDNLDALRFYQRRGFRLASVRPGAADRSRALLKPEIPRDGAYGIPLRDEIELELALDTGTEWTAPAPGPADHSSGKTRSELP